VTKILNMDELFFTQNTSAKNSGSTMCARLLLLPVMLAFFALCHFSELYAQHRDVPYVPTPYETVEKMLDLANVGPGDYVIDLGSGDGRIVIAAAKRGAYGHGVDIDPRRISEARRNAVNAGMEDRVLFIEGNLFETDFSRASVVTMYLLNSVNMKLRPYLLKNLKPGTRVVSYYFNMNEWKPDKKIEVNMSDVFFWIIPATVKGKWHWKTGNEVFEMNANQEFQEVEIHLKSGDTAMNVKNVLLKGDKLSFSAENPGSGINYIFNGRIDAGKISGTVQIRDSENTSVKNWDATNNIIIKN
jgi:SAM-dependent methyltransferase